MSERVKNATAESTVGGNWLGKVHYWNPATGTWSATASPVTW
jgi:hypothetical protein